MSQARFFISRRTALCVLTAGGVFSAFWRTDDLEQQVQEALRAIDLGFAPAKLDLRALHVPAGELRHMQAVVELTWGPGSRRRVFHAAGRDRAQTISDLISQVTAHYVALA